MTKPWDFGVVFLVVEGLKRKKKLKAVGFAESSLILIMEARKKVFIRQPFTGSTKEGQRLLQDCMDVLKSMEGEFSLDFLTSLEAQHSGSFKSSFEITQNKEFTPKNFRSFRLSLIDQSDAFVFLRTALSESGSYEVAYNIYSGKKSPIFYAIWKESPIKTTLLRDLEELVDITYFQFESAEDLRRPLKEFFRQLN